VQARRAAFEQCRAQPAGQLDADLAHRRRVVGVGLDGGQHPTGQLRAGQQSHPLDLRDVRDRHDARDDRQVRPGRGYPVDQRQICLGFEEQLGDREGCAGVRLGGQHGRVRLQRRGLGVLVREGGDRDVERAQRSDELDQFDGMVEAVRMRRPRLAEPAWRVATQRQHVAHAGVGIGADHLPQLRSRVADAGEMSHRGERGLLADTTGDVDHRAPVRATGAVGDRHERRVQALQAPDRLPQLGGTGRILGREELERVRPLTAREHRRHADAARTPTAARGATTHAAQG